MVMDLNRRIRAVKVICWVVSVAGVVAFLFVIEALPGRPRTILLSLVSLLGFAQIVLAFLYDHPTELLLFGVVVGFLCIALGLLLFV